MIESALALAIGPGLPLTVAGLCSLALASLIAYLRG